MSDQSSDTTTEIGGDEKASDASTTECQKADTVPPGSDAVDDKKHQQLIARVEKGMDRRFEDISDYLVDRLRKEMVPIIKNEVNAAVEPMREILQHLTDETSKANNHTVQLKVLGTTLEGLKAICPYCKDIADAAVEAVTSQSDHK